MDGLETLRELKQQNAAAPVVMATAYASIELAVDALKLGATDFVRKPMTPEVLRNAVAAALVKSQAAAQEQQPVIQTITMNGFTILDDELYANLKTVDADQRHVIATAYDEPEFYKDKLRVLFDDDRTAPMLWTREWGKGRVFVTALGHDVKAMQNEGFRKTLVRGAEWAATGE